MVKSVWPDWIAATRAEGSLMISMVILAIFGFRHAKRAEAERVAAAPVTTKDYAPTNA